ncbi:MAG: hypothetical protein JNJ54_09680 [Myxococcaceae bacterium]|nr:hypothetical protein [Myxococcaceae bacterium]
MKPRSIGFPCARHESAEVREFLPPLFGFLQQFGLDRVVIEEGYGQRMAIPAASYDAALPGLQRGTREQALSQELVVMLRCPSMPDLRRLRPGAVLVAMLHFPTRPERAALMEALRVTGVAMDQIVDDLGRRLIENLEAVGFNGVRVGMEALASTWPGFDSPERPPLHATVLGGGAVGAHAVRAAVRYGDDQVRARLGAAGVAGVRVTVLDVELTQNGPLLDDVLRTTDLLVDATQRRDVSRPVVRNDQLAHLPAHAVIVDLSVDPYDFDRNPPAVRGLEGIPEGTLDQYVFAPDDPAWDLLDARVPHAARRTVASCYSWPGIRPVDCMTVYGKQLEPVLRALIERGTDLPAQGGTWAERATGRGCHRRWVMGGRDLIEAAGGALLRAEITSKAGSR